MANAPQTTGELFKAKALTDRDIADGVDAFMADPSTSAFLIGDGYRIDVAEAVLAHEWASVTMANREATDHLKRAVVRTAASLPPKDIGTHLMRRALDPIIGPLTDMDVEVSEREARAAMFSGAMGSYKNPQSHRKFALDDANEAAEIIMPANHLLRIVDDRSAARPREGAAPPTAR